MRHITDPIEALMHALHSAGTSRRLIGLVGLPGAGKSTQAELWAKLINERCSQPVAQAVSMDGFHLTKAELDQLSHPQEAHARRGSYWTFDAEGLAQRLESLRECQADGSPSEVLWPTFDHQAGDPVAHGQVVAGTTRLVILEGLYLLLGREDGWRVREVLDEVWFLSVDLDQAMRQLEARHCRVWQISAEEARARIARNDLLNAQKVETTRSRAEAWVDPLPISF
ncbi:MAG: hypothetical protein RL357_1959 [Pseudomonadota bacterium]